LGVSGFVRDFAFSISLALTDISSLQSAGVGRWVSRETMSNAHNVSEGTDHTTFHSRYAGRQGRMLIQHVQKPPSCPMHHKKAPRRIKRRWELGGATCRQKMHMGKVCKGEKDSSIQEVFSILL
jgi:hypothetical protein